MNRTGNGPLAQQNQGDSASAGDGMERGLSNRHVQFIAIGGTIGTGLFLGSGKSIALTGPSIILVYIGVGLIMYLLMRAIGELMYRSPVQHTFIAFISRYLGQGWGVLRRLVLLDRTHPDRHVRADRRGHLLRHFLRHLRH